MTEPRTEAGRAILAGWDGDGFGDSEVITREGLVTVILPIEVEADKAGYNRGLADGYDAGYADGKREAEAAVGPRDEGLLARWPEAMLFAALDAEGWFRGQDTADCRRATKKLYDRLAALSKASE